MKKLMLLVVIMGVGYLSSCDTESPKPLEEDFAAIWVTTHHFVSMEVAYVLPEIFQEQIEEQVEIESSTDVSGDEVYRLAFRDDGTGSGLVWVQNEQKRLDFDFDWQWTDDQLTITDPNYQRAVMLIAGDHYHSGGEVVWNVEEHTDNKLVLTTTGALLCDSSIDDYLVSWREEYFFRYTFERVK